MLGAIRARFNPGPVEDVCESYEYRIDGTVFHARVNHGEVELAMGVADDPAVTLTTDLATLLSLGAGVVTIEAGLESGAVEVSGDPEAGMRMAAAFGAGVPTVA